MDKYETLEIVQKDPNSSVFHLYLNRPSRRNALSRELFIEFPKALSFLDQNPSVHVIVLSGAGDHFCAGIDLNILNSESEKFLSADRGRVAESIRRDIKGMQDSITAIERCRKPVIASVHGGCIGGGIDIVTACDIRYCTADAFFSVKEVDLGITADLGTLQRLPAIVGYGTAVELALTGRRFSGTEAQRMGLVSQTFGSKKQLDEAVNVIAKGKFSHLKLFPQYFHNFFFISFASFQVARAWFRIHLISDWNLELLLSILNLMIYEGKFPFTLFLGFPYFLI